MVEPASESTGEDLWASAVETTEGSVDLVDAAPHLVVGTRVFHRARGPGTVQDIDLNDRRGKPYGYTAPCLHAMYASTHACMNVCVTTGWPMTTESFIGVCLPISSRQVLLGFDWPWMLMRRYSAKSVLKLSVEVERESPLRDDLLRLHSTRQACHTPMHSRMHARTHAHTHACPHACTSPPTFPPIYRDSLGRSPPTTTTDCCHPIPRRATRHCRRRRRMSRHRLLRCRPRRRRRRWRGAIGRTCPRGQPAS